MSDLLEKIKRLADDAVADLQPRTAERLDFSEASLATVEALADEAAEFFPDFPQERRRLLQQRVGCYVLEVGRRAFGGVYGWHEAAGEPVLVVGAPEAHIAIMTWSKALTRLDGQKADNLAYHFAGFASRARSATPGDVVTFV